MTGKARNGGSQPQHVTTSRRLWVGFGTLIGLLVLVCATGLLSVRSIETAVREQEDVAGPRSNASRELAINVMGYALALRSFARTGNPGYLDDAASHLTAGDRNLLQYQLLATTERQRELADRFAVLWGEYRDFGALLLAKRNPLDHETSEKLSRMRIGLERFLDDEVHKDAFDSYNVRREETFRAMRTLVGTLLTLLVVGVVLAVTTSGAIGRAIIRGERVVAEQAERLRTTLASIGDGVIATDAAGLVTNLNAVAEALTGWTNAEAIGQPLDAVFRIVNEGDHTTLVARDGSQRPIDDSAAPIRCKEGEIVGRVLVFRDITERHRSERALREADRRKDEFLATLAHELRNPLAPVRNAVQVLHQKGRDQPEMQWATDLIERQLQAVSRLIDDLMDVSRINQGRIELRRERLELRKVLEGAIETSRSLLEESGHQLTLWLPPGRVTVDADRTRLAQVFQNLLNNAAKYTERGGRIDLVARRDRDHVVVSVKDTGIGIPRDKLPTLFEMFSQVEGALSRSQGGLGIGLCLVKRLVEMHGGQVEARSDGPGTGSEFVVRLPIVVDDAQEPEKTLDLPRPTPTSTLRVLVVDDNEDAATSSAMLLTMMGNEVRIAHDGEQAVEAARAFHPHVVLLDLGLPRMNGYDAARAIRKETWSKGMTLIAVTGWGQEADRRRSEEAGFDRHLVKPVDPQFLMKLLVDLPHVTG